MQRSVGFCMPRGLGSTCHPSTIFCSDVVTKVPTVWGIKQFKCQMSGNFEWFALYWVGALFWVGVIFHDQRDSGKWPWFQFTPKNRPVNYKVIPSKLCFLSSKKRIRIPGITWWIINLSSHIVWLELGAGGLDLWLPGFVPPTKKKWREIISPIVVPDLYLIVLEKSATGQGLARKPERSAFLHDSRGAAVAVGDRVVASVMATSSCSGHDWNVTVLLFSWGEFLTRNLFLRGLLVHVSLHLSTFKARKCGLLPFQARPGCLRRECFGFWDIESTVKSAAWQSSMTFLIEVP